MKIKTFGLVAIALVACGCSSKSYSLPEESGTLSDVVASLSFAAEGSNGFVVPTATELAQFRTAMNSLLSGSLENAHSKMNNLGYDLVNFLDSSATHFYILRESSATSARGWGFFVINPSPDLKIILEAPHPLSDISTDDEAAEFFVALKAQALLIAGSHRCADTEESPCSGTTDACGSDGTLAPYRVSDASHSTNQIFQVAHEVLMDSDSALFSVALHGFSRGAGDPHAFVSDGTTNVEGESAISNRFVSSIAAGSKIADIAKSCNDGSGGVRLCGTEDVQGRYVNGSADACAIAASNSSGRFLHIEQSVDLRTSGNGVDRSMVLGALESLF